MIEVSVLVSNKSWKKYLKNPELYLKRRVTKLNKNISLFKKNKIFFSILLSGNERIKKLNKKYRNKNETTDILSFPFYEKRKLNQLIKKKEKIYLGDIIININKITKKSKNFFFIKYFDKIWVHGLTHLLGYKHKSNQDYLAMTKIEKNFLKVIN